MTLISLLYPLVVIYLLHRASSFWYWQAVRRASRAKGAGSRPHIIPETL